MKWEFKYLEEMNAVLAECSGEATIDRVRKFRREGIKALRKQRSNKAILDYRNVEYLLSPVDIANSPADYLELGAEDIQYAIVMPKNTETYHNLKLHLSNLGVHNYLYGTGFIYQLFENIDEAVHWLKSL